MQPVTPPATHFVRASPAAVILLTLVSTFPLTTRAVPAPFTPNDHVCDGVSAVTYQILQCLQSALTQADQALNQLYTLIMKELSAGPANPYAVYTDKKHDLQQAELAWVNFRDTQCRIEGELLAPGTGVPLETAGCQLKLTNERLRFLQRYEREIGRDSKYCKAHSDICEADP